MRFTKSTALVLALSLAAGSTAAFAGEQENSSSCAAAAHQVSAALDQAGQNADARHEKQRGLEFCNAGFYHQGMAHYAKAMEILGAKVSRN